MDSELMPELDAPVTAAAASRSQRWIGDFFYIAQLTLRILVITFSLAGAILTTTSKQSVTVFGIVMEASYTYSSAFRFKVVADSLVCGLSVLSVVHVISLNRPKSNLKNYFYLLLHDLVSVLVLLSGCTAATAIGYVGEYGQDQTGWIAICGRVPTFCNKIMVSIVSSFLAVIGLVVLVLLSAYKLKSAPYLEITSVRRDDEAAT